MIKTLSKVSAVEFSKLKLKFESFDNLEFISCNFTHSLFNHTSFSQCRFSGCCFSGVDFSEIKLKKCVFDNTLITYATFHQERTDISHELVNLDLRGNVFCECNLSEANFELCNLTEVKFDNCNLTKTVFKKCNLTSTDFSNSNINAVYFPLSTIHNTILELNGFIQYGNSQGFILKKITSD